jgi:hypothetical protein
MTVMPTGVSAGTAIDAGSIAKSESMTSTTAGAACACAPAAVPSADDVALQPAATNVNVIAPAVIAVRFLCIVVAPSLVETG